MTSILVNWQLSILSIVPILVISLVCLQLVYKAYIKIRSKFSKRVNCWFCNENASVPYLEYNSWTCTNCEQYNGFDKNGDYNREIPQQYKNCSNTSGSTYLAFVNGTTNLDTSRNGFCDACNEAQRLKIEKISQFEPKKEKNYEKELKAYKAQLEEQYRICSTCERHLKKVLRDCKKKVIGAKFMEFVLKSADSVLQPHYQMLRSAVKQHWKQNLTLLVTCFSFFNIWYITSVDIDSFKLSDVTQFFGATLGGYLFFMISHMLALVHVLNTYFMELLELEAVLKLRLFVHTILKLSLYAVGIKSPLHTVYMQAHPFIVLALALMHNFVDHFKLTRHTFLLVLWSTFAGGLLKDLSSGWMCLSSLLTLFLSITNNTATSPKLLDNTATSFHKLYADDSYSEDETESLLSTYLQSPSERSFRTAYGMARSSSPRPSHAAASRAKLTANHTLHHTPYQGTSVRSALHNSQHQSTVYMKPSSFRPINYAPSMSNFNSSRHATSYYDTANDDILSGNLTMTESNRTVMSPRHPYNQSYLNQSLNASSRRSFKPLHSADVLNESRYSNMSVSNANMSFHYVPPLRSPYSSSNMELRHKTVLSPSRFSTNDISLAAQVPWLTNKPSMPYPAPSFTANHLLNDTSASMPQMPMSRSSSHSSGFESQNERPVASRENSLGLDVGSGIGGGVDGIASRTLTANSFRPIEPLRRNLGNLTNHYESSLGSQRTRPTNSSPFNLHKLTDGLKTIQRGDLLKKWMESQAGDNLVESN